MPWHVLTLFLMPCALALLTLALAMMTGGRGRRADDIWSGPAARQGLSPGRAD